MQTRLVARRQNWPLKAPFRISRGVKTAAETVEVEAERDGVTGRGECVPYARYGETPHSVVAQIEAVIGAADPLALLPPGAARNAVDCALWDLEARRTGVSVAQRIGRRAPGPLVTAVTVSLDEPEAMARAAAAVADAPLLKVKVGADDPGARVRAVAAAAPKARLIVDPNEGWDFPLLARMQPLLAELGVALVEQPLPADRDDALEGWRPAVPICADESVHTAEDLPGLRGRYQAVNVKLDKTGGLTGALQLLDAARAAGFLVMTGCMVCSSLSIAPALHVAAVSDFVDLDGPGGWPPTAPAVCGWRTES